MLTAPTVPDTEISPRVTMADLARIMLYIGIAGYGGGPAIIAYLKQILVSREKWMSEADYLTGVSLSQLLPGANALGVVVFVGFQLVGSLGSLVAAVCFLFPSLVLMTGLSALYFAFGSLPFVHKLFIGLGAVVVGLLLNALIVMGRSAIKQLRTAGIAVVTFLLIFFCRVPILLLVGISALLGLLLLPRATAPADDDEPKIANGSGTQFWLRWGIAFLAVCLLLFFTRHTTISQLCFGLMRVGALTFGGGYTSIPLFQREAVNVRHLGVLWLTTHQFLDGLALGQITPGPVIITGTFIGYKVLGVFGAFIATVAVFLPGGLSMYFLAHQHEQMKKLLWLQPIVRGIVAGFIGVLFSVTIHLAQTSIVEWKTATLAVASSSALIFFKRDPLWVILGGAALTLLLYR